MDDYIVKANKPNFYRMGVQIPDKETPLSVLMPDLKKSGRTEEVIIEELKRDGRIDLTVVVKEKPEPKKEPKKEPESKKEEK